MFQSCVFSYSACIPIGLSLLASRGKISSNFVACWTITSSFPGSNNDFLYILTICLLLLSFAVVSCHEPPFDFTIVSTDPTYSPIFMASIFN